MSLIGLDFGSHMASIAIWSEDKDSFEVIADDLGNRAIASMVAFRGDEIITGQTAVSQQYKNAANSFDDVRGLLLDASKGEVNVPLLEREIPVSELGSHFFRNIHNQIKQQVGKVLRDTVIVLPAVLDGDAKKRLLESAQAGGIRIKSVIDDCTATLLAYQLDNAELPPAKTVVVDIGWSRSTVAVYDISGGIFFPLSTTSTSEMSGSVAVSLLAAHCAKDFLRKTKIPCAENKKSMMRLQRECENAMKSLSTGQEAMIDIDSLCEGADFSLKVSRARFEDLLMTPFMQLKNTIKGALTAAGLEASAVQQLCVGGGLSSIPKVGSTLKTLFPTANFLRGRFEATETHCVGAANHAKHLFEQGLIDSAPTDSPVAACLLLPLLLKTSIKDSEAMLIAPAKTVLPLNIELPATVADSSGYLQVLIGSSEAADAPTPVGEIVFTIDTSSSTAEPTSSEAAAAAVDTSAVVVTVTVSEEAEITVEVKQTATGVIVGSLTVSPTA